MKLTGSNLVVSWRTNYVGYTLQSSTNLANWIDSTNAPAASSYQNVVTNALPGGPAFFRLRK